MIELLVLQRLHNNETGQDCVISGPLPEPDEEPSFDYLLAMEGEGAKIDLGKPPLMEYYQYPEGKPAHLN